MLLNHPETIPHPPSPSVEKLSSTKPGPGAKKFGDCSAAAAKSLQSYPTLCDPINGSPPGSPVPEILQARTLEWVAIAFYSKPIPNLFFFFGVVY